MSRLLRGALAATAALLAGAIGLAPAAHAQPGDTPPVEVTVVSITPSTPQPSQGLQLLTVRLHLENTTDAPLHNVAVELHRGDPLFDQDALDTSLEQRTVPTSGLAIPQINSKHPPTADLPVGGGADVTFRTRTGVPFDAPLCLCAKDDRGRYGVYPLYFSANLGSTRLGAVTTYLPSFYSTPKPVQVSWVWPLIDRPHRLLEGTTFIDDSLATSVAAGGRLDRALRVVEDVGAEIPLTLVLDPELIDELEVMKTGHYAVQANPSARATPGKGQQAATLWLDRLRTVLADDPGVSVELTPFADPDLETLRENRLSWTGGLPASMLGALTDVLGSRSATSDLAWPAAGEVSSRTLDTLVRSDVTGVLLNGNTVLPRTDSAGVPTGVARLNTRHGPITAALTSPQIQQDAASAIGTAGGGALPALVATVAMRAAQEPTVAHPLVIAAPRYVDPSPADADRAIRETSSSPFSRPAPLGETLYGSGPSLVTGHLARPPSDDTPLVSTNLDAAHTISADLPTLTSLLGGSNAAANQLLATLPLAVQRIESSAWRIDPAAGEQLAQRLADKVQRLLAGVYIVKPSTKSGSYTLASDNSPLPITVENTLRYPVQVRVSVKTVNKLPGFTAKTTEARTIDPGSKLPLQVSTKMERRGRIQVQAQLIAPDGTPLGAPVGLSIRSTFLGTIGVVITVVAGAVLLFALLIRLFGRVRARRRRAAIPVERRHLAALPPESMPEATPDPVAGSGP